MRGGGLVGVALESSGSDNEQRGDERRGDDSNDGAEVDDSGAIRGEQLVVMGDTERYDDSSSGDFSQLGEPGGDTHLVERLMDRPRLTDLDPDLEVDPESNVSVNFRSKGDSVVESQRVSSSSIGKAKSEGATMGWLFMTVGNDESEGTDLTNTCEDSSLDIAIAWGLGAEE
ncbi:hypothetical protein L218DRAFT_945216 [Marasmius fiardii PR-910]|nr:hypothetical protein L218DRAFT_945216 [Marasmius fiardii PR-910]